ncbi:hypothetical protein DFH06DRAFT_1489289 [Mycena polygramma]|nr:hypothetical protein DFH06DRAFT_1489289 [Mycena polygramma]
MDPSSTRRFLSTNVEWPAEKLFIPRGGLTNFLCDNLRFKVFLVMTAVFTDAYAFDTVKSLTTGERLAIRFRVRDMSAIWQLFIIAPALRPFIPFRLSTPLADPFDYNLILSRIHEEERRECNRRNAEARPASAQRHSVPTLPIVHEAEDVADAAVINAALNASFRFIKKLPTRRSYRVLASHLAEGPLVPDEFFVKEEERALSECSSGSMPSLVTPSVTGGSTTV